MQPTLNIDPVEKSYPFDLQQLRKLELKAANVTSVTSGIDLEVK